MRLFIAEKPSLAKAIAENLGEGKSCDGYISIHGGKDIVSWCYGHILALCSPESYDTKYKSWNLSDLPIVPQNWQLTVTPSCKKQFLVLKKLISQADTIVNAGDPDREGQLLVDEVISYVGCHKPVQRILLNALDSSSVQYALNHIQDNSDFINLRNSALARSRADWLVGMNLTRAYSKKLEALGMGVFSFGRVQTPTMSLVVRRDREIASFKPVDHYQLKVIWAHKKGMVETFWKMKDDQPGLDSEGRLLEKKYADAMRDKLSGMSGVIESVDQKKKSESPTLPYSLSALQIAAGRKFKYTPQEVLDTMQSLYEKKYTSYPRSDCDYLPENQFSDAKEILSNIKSLSIDGVSNYVDKADINIKNRCWNDKKITAHHAIIPTCVKADLQKLTEKERNLYGLVCLNYIAQFYPIYIYEDTSITVKAADEYFVGRGRVVIDIGWKKLYITEKSEDEKNEDDNVQLPLVHTGEAVAYHLGGVLNKTTKPPSRFNPSTLLKAMKEIYKYVKDADLKKSLKNCSGIGTEATRAAIIEGLQKRGYLELKKNLFFPTEKAITLYDNLPDIYAYPDNTAIWEQKLSDILNGDFSVAKFLKMQVEAIEKLLSVIVSKKLKVDVEEYLCPSCQSTLVKKKGPKGFFWGCSSYPTCRYTTFDQGGKPCLEPQKEHEAYPCPICVKGQLRYINFHGSKFWGCSDLTCRTSFPDNNDKPLIISCPMCKKSYLKRIKGKKGFFWACCSKSCKAIYSDSKGYPEIK